MIPLPTARRRAEEFDAALRSREDSPANQGEFADLVTIVTRLRSEAASLPAPRADFAADLRGRLLLEADTVLVPASADDEAHLRLRPSTHTPRRTRRIAAIAAAAVISGTTSTVAYAAQDALPGDSLYSVKRALENARGTVTLTDGAKGAVTLRHAEQRLDEVAALIDRGNDPSLSAVPDALDDFTSQTEEASDLILADADNGDSATKVAGLREFVASSVGTLERLEPSLDGDAREPLGRAVSALRDIDQRALDLCPACGSGNSVDVPFSLSAAGDLFDSGIAADPPELPEFSADELPPGSVAGAQSEEPSSGPQPEEDAAAPSDPSPSPGSGSSTSAPSPPSPSAPTSPTPSSPESNGGITDLTDPVTEATGPLSGALRGVTETLDRLLGLNR